MPAQAKKDKEEIKTQSNAEVAKESTPTAPASDVSSKSLETQEEKQEVKAASGGGDTSWPQAQAVDATQQESATPQQANVEKPDETKSSEEEEGHYFIEEDKSSKKKSFIFILLFVLLGLAFVGGIFFFRNQILRFFSQKFQKGGGTQEQTISSSSNKKVQTTPTVQPTPEKIDLSEYNIKVLNGSGIKGEAARIRDELEKLGFTVSSVGNAESSDYDETEVKAKKSVSPAFLKKLISSLEESFKVASGAALAKSEKDDVVVIIGSKGAE